MTARSKLQKAHKASRKKRDELKQQLQRVYTEEQAREINDQLENARDQWNRNNPKRHGT